MKTEFRNWTELILGAELIPQCATSRNRMYSLPKSVSTLDGIVLYSMILCHFICHMMEKNSMYSFEKGSYHC
jgi:hypothetical protein